MTASEAHKLKALQTYLNTQGVNEDMNTLKHLQRYMQIMQGTEMLCSEAANTFLHFLQRIEDMLAEVKLAEDTLLTLDTNRN